MGCSAWHITLWTSDLAASCFCPQESRTPKVQWFLMISLCCYMLIKASDHIRYMWSYLWPFWPKTKCFGMERSVPMNFSSPYEPSYLLHDEALQRTSRVSRGGEALVVRQHQPWRNLLKGNIGEKSLASPNQFLESFRAGWKTTLKTTQT